MKKHANTPRSTPETRHNFEGNCRSKATVFGCYFCPGSCHKCHAHDQTRGQCSLCPRCEACKKA